MQELLIVGAGGFGREAAEAVAAVNDDKPTYELLGFLDDNPDAAGTEVEGIPVLYLPFATHPVQKTPRQSGFLIPNIGKSSTRGYTAGESLFWAINPSMDLHAGAEYF